MTREDHGELANAQIRLYAESKKAQERQSMGFRLSEWDQKLLAFAAQFEAKMMNLQVNISLEEALDLGWKILSNCFESYEIGIKPSILEKYWPIGK